MNNVKTNVNDTKKIILTNINIPNLNTKIMPSGDRLSASQDQLFTSIKQLQDAQNANMDEYANAQTTVERNRIMEKMKQNEALRSNLLASAGTVNLVQSRQAAVERSAAEDIAFAVSIAEQQLNNQREQLEALQESHDGKKRMIELNTYYGKRFMAQASVLKIFIYMCIPILILTVLVNAGLFPSYIAGLLIILITVVGIVYIYTGISDINRRDKRNFDEYTWEFDPSRVGTIVNPNYGTTGSGAKGTVVGCFNGNCCGANTSWDAASGTCIPNPSSIPTAAPSSNPRKGTSSLPGDLNSL